MFILRTLKPLKHSKQWISMIRFAFFKDALATPPLQSTSPTLQPRPVQAGGRLWIQSRLEKVASVGKERNEQD